jgi:hypothetical protein
MEAVLRPHNTAKDATILRHSIIWNPNIVIPGQPGKKRKLDPDHGVAQTQRNRIDKELIPKTHDRTFDNGTPTSDTWKWISELNVGFKATGKWKRASRADGGKFFYSEDLPTVATHPYIDFKDQDDEDNRKLNLKDGTLN